MAALSRALFLAFFICAIQASVAESSISELLDSVKALEQKTEDALTALKSNITNAITTEEQHVTDAVSSDVTASETEVKALVAAAEAEGIDAASCSAVATKNLTSITTGLPASLYHCAVDYLDAFNYYVQNVETDFSLIYQAFEEGNQKISECTLLELDCYATNYYNITKFVAVKEADIAFQALNAQTAGVNLIATITKCDEEKSTQATLDAAEVVPETSECIKQLKAANARR